MSLARSVMLSLASKARQYNREAVRLSKQGKNNWQVCCLRDQRDRYMFKARECQKLIIR